jgi:hypothetical protein
MKGSSAAIVNTMAAVKSDERSLSLRREFFEESSQPADTKQ